MGLESASNLVHLNGLTIDNGGASFIVNHTTGTPTNVIIASASNLVLGSPTDDIDLNNNFIVITGEGSQLPFFAVDISFAAIVSSTVNSDRAGGNFDTGIGAIQNISPSNSAIYTSFGGDTTVTSSDVLIRYTYLGDADLSGTVNALDYLQIDGGFNSPPSANPGWYNGDFNYDHNINGDDYTMIDNAFNASQGASLGARTARVASELAMVAAAPKSVPAAAAATGSAAPEDSFRRKKTKLSLISELEQSGGN